MEKPSTGPSFIHSQSAHCTGAPQGSDRNRRTAGRIALPRAPRQVPQLRASGPQAGESADGGAGAGTRARLRAAVGEPSRAPGLQHPEVFPGNLIAKEFKQITRGKIQSNRFKKLKILGQFYFVPD